MFSRFDSTVAANTLQHTLQILLQHTLQYTLQRTLQHTMQHTLASLFGVRSGSPRGTRLLLHTHCNTHCNTQCRIPWRRFQSYGPVAQLLGTKNNLLLMGARGTPTPNIDAKVLCSACCSVCCSVWYRVSCSVCCSRNCAHMPGGVLCAGACVSVRSLLVYSTWLLVRRARGRRYQRALRLTSALCSNS